MRTYRHPVARTHLARSAQPALVPVGGAQPEGRRGQRTVALLVETSNSYARGLLTGIIQYTSERTSWSTYLAEHGRGDAPPEWLSHWKGDGIIARIENV